MRGGPREGKIQKTSFKGVKIFLRMKPPFFFIFQTSFEYYTAVSLCLLQETSRKQKRNGHNTVTPSRTGFFVVDRTRLGILRDDQRTSIILESILISGWIL